jgi:hypothetical protein
MPSKGCLGVADFSVEWGREKLPRWYGPPAATQPLIEPTPTPNLLQSPCPPLGEPTAFKLFQTETEETMSKTSLVVIASLFAAFFCASSRGEETKQSGTQNKAPVVQHWEYKVLRVAENPDLNLLGDLGDEGWEMCGVQSHPNAGGTIYFKRPKKVGVGTLQLVPPLDGTQPNLLPTTPNGTIPPNTYRRTSDGSNGLPLPTPAER